MAGEADDQRQRGDTWDRLSHAWSLLLEDCNEDHIDEHEEFIRSVRAFHCDLLRHSQPQDDRKAGISDAKSSAPKAFIPGNEQYISRFAQPCPARPIWAALPRPKRSEKLFLPSETWASDYSCAPLVCVAFHDSPELRDPVRQALCKLAAHPVGLVVNVKAVAAEESENGQQLLFAIVGLSPPSTQTGGEGSFHYNDGSPGSLVYASKSASERKLMSKADQRQIVWAAAHEALQDEEEHLPGLVEEIYMLQDVYLYDRLFRWLTVAKRTYGGPLRSLSKNELDLLVHEFGEEIATHFLFVARYIKHLRVAAVVSLLCLLVTLLDSHGWLGDAPTVENMKRSFLVLFLPAWGFHFLASWRSAASRAGFRWLGSLGSVQNSVKELARLQAMESVGEKHARYFRVLVLSVPLMLMQMIVVFSTTVTFVCFEVYIYDVIWEALSSTARIIAFLVYNLAFGVAFILMLGLFHPISKAVTRWERHPDNDTADWHLTAKIYANWFFAVFLYFFVIAFCYIPFGDNIADLIASTYPSTDARSMGSTERQLHERYSIRGALEAFRPDIRRLGFDVALFFLLQDSARLMQVLVPVVRSAWGFGGRQGVQKGGRHRRKRTAIFFDAWAMCRLRCCCPRRSCDESRAPELGEWNTSEAQRLRPSSEMGPAGPTFSRRPSAMALVPAQVPKEPKAPAYAIGEESVFVVFCLLDHVRILTGTPSSEAEQLGQPVQSTSTTMSGLLAPDVVMLACQLDRRGLEAPKPGGAGAPPDPVVVTSRLRVCHASDGKGYNCEDPCEAAMGDLLTLTCDPLSLDRQAQKGHLRLCAEVLESAPSRPDTRSVSVGSDSDKIWKSSERIPFDCDGITKGQAILGNVQVNYLVGVVHAQTHHEALERVPRAVRRAKQDLPVEAPEEVPDPKDAATEEALSLEADGSLPWHWWDGKLTENYWDEVFDLYTVKESFETFELYAHLATQFSYVTLFSIAVPACPLLAWFFTAIEARQDQLRLLWLSRPPHPHQETMRFKRSISLGAWYTIIRFTCHMSVIVNLLLWGLTYRGIGETDPADWSSSEWWRAIAIYLISQHTYFFLGGVLHRNVSQLDHATATAYLRRCQKLQQALQEESAEDATPRCSRQVDRVITRRRLTRTGSQGLSSII